MEQRFSPSVRIEFTMVFHVWWDNLSHDRGRKELSRSRRRSRDCSYRQAAMIMAAKGKRLVVSLKNGFEDATPVNQKVGRPCPVPMDEIVKGMSGVQLQGCQIATFIVNFLPLAAEVFFWLRCFAV